MDKRRITFLVVAILFVAIITVGGSYAFFAWTSGGNKVVLFNVVKKLREYIDYDAGESKFIGDFKVSDDYTDGIHATISVKKKENSPSVNLMATINMDINKIGVNMTNSTALKWIVTNGSNVTDILGQGNFIGTTNGDTISLVSSIEVTNQIKEFTIWIWLDENEYPSDALSGETLDAVVWTQIDQLEGIGNVYEVTKINAYYQTISATVINNKHVITDYAIIKHNRNITSWDNIPQEERHHIDLNKQTNIYNLVDKEIVNSTGTYDVWFNAAYDNSDHAIYESVVVENIDISIPSCSFGNFSTDEISDGETATITMTCVDLESELVINEIKPNKFVVPGLSNDSNVIEVTGVSKVPIANGYQYLIAVTAKEYDGDSTITLPANTVRNAMHLGNSELTSSASISVQNSNNIRHATVTLSQNSYLYDGNEQTPAVTVIKNGNTLTKDVDYTVNYSNNINVGQATITITGINGYKGVATKTFTIEYSTYTVTFVSAENACPLGSEYGVVNATYNMSFNKDNPTCTGYTFDGWTATGIDSNTAMYGNTSNGITVPWINGNNKIKGKYFLNLTSVQEGTVVLTANWTPNTYTISYEDNLFDVDVSKVGSATASYNSNTQTLTLNGNVSNSSTSFNVTDYSMSEGDTYRIFFKYISGSFSESDFGDPIRINFYYTRQGSTVGGLQKLFFPTSEQPITFKEVTIDESLSGVNGIYISISKPYAYQNGGYSTASFNNYKVQILVTKVHSKTVTYNETYGNLPVPSKWGYTFDGWYIDNNTKVTSTSVVTTARDHTLYAHWSKVVFPNSIMTAGSWIRPTNNFLSTKITREQIGNITFSNSLEGHSVNNTTCWDVGNIKDKTILAWTTGQNDNGLYDMTIGSVGGVNAHTNSSYWFANMINLVTIYGANNFDTSNVTSMSSMFSSIWNALNITNYDFLGYFDTSNVVLMNSMFYGVKYDGTLNISNWDVSNVRSMSSMFSSLNCTSGIDISNWNTSNVTSMSSMFSSIKFENLNVSNLDTSNVVSMASMFSSSSNLVNLDLSNWNTSKVTDMGGMFYNDFKLTNLNLTNFNTSRVVNMDNMFSSAYSLTKLDLNNWDVSKVRDMSDMFYNANNLTTLNVSNWNTSSLETTSWMFASAYRLSDLDVSNWNTSNIRYMSWMFSNARNLKNIDVSNWNTARVTSMATMFNYAVNLTNLDVSNFDTSNVTTMTNMFANTFNLTSLDVSNWDISNVKNIDYMFNSTRKITALDLNNWNTSKIENMGAVFANTVLTSLNISNWDTSNVYSMWSLFNNTKTLQSLDIGNWNLSKLNSVSNMFANSGFVTLNLSNWNLQRITEFSNMFRNATNLVNLDLSNWNLASARNMSYMFYDTKKLKNLDVSNWNVSSVKDMSYMFVNTGLTTLNIGNWNISNVDFTTSMFHNAVNLTTVYVGSGWDVDRLVLSFNMFYNTVNITGGAGTTYKSSVTDKTYAKIDGGSSDPGYFTEAIASRGANLLKAGNASNAFVQTIGSYSEIDECNNNCGTTCLSSENNYVCPSYSCSDGVLSGTECYA